MADGKGCKCAAHSESECACDADWTPQEVFDLRSAAELLRVRIKVLETAIRLIAEQDATLSACEGNVTVTMDAALTDEEREAIWTVAEAYAENGGDPESERIATIMQGLWQRTR
jgi:hypothetical protein